MKQLETVNRLNNLNSSAGTNRNVF